MLKILAGGWLFFTVLGVLLMMLGAMSVGFWLIFGTLLVVIYSAWAFPNA